MFYVQYTRTYVHCVSFRKFLLELQVNALKLINSLNIEITYTEHVCADCRVSSLGRQKINISFNIS